MDRLDINEILDKNPQVDRDTIMRRLEKLSKTTPEQLKGNPISPYGGRRATADTRLKPSTVRVSRTA
jgi:hypothetical protein